MGKSTLKGAKKATKYRAKPVDREKSFDIKQSRLNSRLDTFEDAMTGDEDQFHLNRDKMLLDEDGYAQNGDDDSLDEPDEIYGLDLPQSQDEDEVEEEEAVEPQPRKNKRLELERKPKKPTYDPNSGRFGHTYDPKQDQVFDSSSEGSDDDDDDVTPAKDQLQSTVSDEEEDDEKKQAGSDSEEDEDRWAAGHYHVSRRAPGEADSEDEEALELEAEEARRLQKKRAEQLRGQDFGIADSDEDQDAEGQDKLEERLDLEREDADQEADQEESKVDTAALNEEESIAHLLKYSPETLALVDDFVRTASKIKDVESDLANIRQTGDGQGGEHPGLAIMELEHQALTTYLPTLAFYFSLLLAPTPQPASLLTKVLNRISSLRQSLATMEELDLTSATYGDEEDEDDDEERDDGKMLASEMFDFRAGLENDDDDEDDDEDEDDSDEEGAEITESMLEGLDDDELEEIMQELSPEDGAEGLMKRVRQRQLEKGILVDQDEEMSEGEEESADEDEQDDEEDEEEEELAPPSKKVKKSVAPVIPTLAPLSASSRKASASASTRPISTAASTSDYLDPSTLSHGDLADKASTRHSLRFHVSQVAQKAARRERLATAVGGDDDVPRRSKEQARREVLKKQQHGAAQDAEAELDGGDWDEDDRKAAKAVRGTAAADRDDGDDDDGANDDEDYYDLVKMEKDEGRKSKKAKYDGDRAAEKAEIEALSASMADGPRGATRQILANKGLTPRRKKENRNARVKKRLRYDKAQKKLSSMKATYKGGESRSGYEGEGSGIARRTVKSRQLG
ncbi:uncharacterized protein JCM15063_006390 [Sporobolomyces koalae]|uniref:uncharacterized protein n=1 Tax=Sporobolomyces koalae TaxID=500713 RepID=UPI00317E921C